MRVLLWHGYLMSGSGSNIYTANVAARWRARGHDVLLMCQERNGRALGFVDRDGDFAADNSSYSAAGTGVEPAAGTCTLVRPCIGEVLPVYVYDHYDGFTAKRFVDLDDSELDRYTDANVAAFSTALSQFEPDAVVTGHEVMGPEIARRACEPAGIRYIAKLHGSALEYAVKVQDRYRVHARAGLGGAAVVTGGSRYMIDAAARVIPEVRDRAVVVNPGCDVSLFKPVPRSHTPGATIGYVGKLIASKGVHHLLAALGLVRLDRLNAVVVGYGGFEDGLEALADALAAGDVDRALEIARAGEHGPLDDLVAFLSSVRSDYGYLARAAAVPVAFTGRLEHDPLSRLLPGFDVLCVPSVVPEAFGMVAAEAAACGVLPVVPAHSGIGEVGAALEDRFDAPGLLTYDPDDPIAGLAACIEGLLRLDPHTRSEMEQAAAAVARERWSWDGVADALLAHATAAPGAGPP